MEKTIRKIDEHTASWYIVCTTAKAENKVKKLLEQFGFETYLPRQLVMRAWNSRIRKVVTPIIPRIVFVYLSKNDIAEMASVNDGAFLLHEKEQYVSISVEQMKAFCDVIEQSNWIIGFVPGDIDAESGQMPKSKEEVGVRHYFTEFILPIKGLGVIWAKKKL